MGFTTLLADEKQAITNHYNQNLSLYEPNFIMKRTWECKFQKIKNEKYSVVMFEDIIGILNMFAKPLPLIIH